GDIEVDETQPKKVVLVGPTGSGKTTTLAKLAAEFALHRGKRVALVSLDTYRLGAVDQLRIYGDIMQVPVEMACDRSDFRR
ncbi:MAG: DEAD/DEAH box helicase family protein, partial [Nitrospinaceae bacterium]|nr:DEAD/DEAH box helicase family protein [Nitrospinaceae bacterium]NIR55776.1 DEAD/DEAH box helicase family protein [Nitrospinaceae bacterium]NIS86228.1 DEAD/DEAH box helicase family protein [Nitrospinaceae bacterium]NIT83059.1 DEAD/DEAH box helicase family protein [Nitrospinaceae bacterium]NIU45269.1 DEAD/DEAH box helicase family protein [Nitrospinaceae bacterium]